MPDSEAKRRWMQENKVHFGLSIMRKTEADILEQLEKQENASRYIKNLIRADIAKEKGQA